MENLNPIACEHCRSKKCRCDRQIPACTQCRTALLTCRYQEGGKRGIPAAYITSLEKRLQETEAALFSVLATVNNDRDAGPRELWKPELVNAMVAHSTSKAGRQEEWRRLPLRSTDQIDNWFKEKRQLAESVEPLSAQKKRAASIEPVIFTPSVLGTDHLERDSPAVSEPSPSVVPASVLDQLRNSTPPSAPNAVHLPLAASTQWRNYF
ncbi:hypothetical protein B0J11DRAFT_300063 [Dendryphion nanum]|uniref:Zn(2)-C6 fungal-type domain-containing protein n=1 Tax=Dendryphion nanum TaxID=256645 RepID=A0A9P9DUC5_9PLEO|nr:hypothetical protein B0J11DRAFT_300063 [Dendryphion nanum]